MSIAASLLTLVCTLAGSDALAFAHVKEGEVIENATLRSDAGAKKAFLAPGKVGVFFFFSPEQEFSQQTLHTFAKLEKEFEGKPVSWAAITSGRHPVPMVKEQVAASGMTIPLLFDDGDALYGRLGGKLTPTVAVVDAQHRLVAYLPFQKINYGVAIGAWLRKALGEYDDAQLQQALNPPAVAQMGGDAQVAKRQLRMGERLLKAEDFEGAAEAGRKCVAADPSLAAGHGLIAAALAASGLCADALPWLHQALELDPEEPLAKAAQARCAAP
jgi:tetratricopeptide (TPR) repeat protein